ncbi:MAG: epoxyqueuosine reductase QueH [Clostridia bacterium]|jgi:hypothetical protein|nr:epoxyqueuosine reductase QueH [Clostridia bacterium]MDD3231999.1 epoxyqueuosine reductase QueH [Clostridia bacterium]MDD3862229.1 epoxyqueuosine reductase QueH [Clostridia bacterium]MDD4408916.1 epoxyqueuosine reductase QueH [Clostridia bacterium]
MKKEQKTSSKNSLLLHSCCAPCSSAVIERLLPDYQITIFYYNPNIFPEEEYLLRKKNQQKLLDILQIPFIEGNYEPTLYEEYMKDFKNQKEGSVRCYNCYKLRLEKTFETAKKLSFENFTTTLSISPRKNAIWINEIGTSLQDNDCKFLVADFKKKDGYKRSIELSKKYDLYRQTYCGCKTSYDDKEH